MAKSFDTTKRKISTLWENSQKNEADIKIQEHKTRIIAGNISRIPPKQIVIGKIDDLGFGWETPDQGIPSVTGVITLMFKNWEVKTIMPESWIETVNWAIAYRIGSGTFGSGPDLLELLTPDINFVVKVGDIENSKLKNVKFVVSVAFEAGVALPDFEIRLFLTASPPLNHV